MTRFTPVGLCATFPLNLDTTKRLNKSLLCFWEEGKAQATARFLSNSIKTKRSPLKNIWAHPSPQASAFPSISPSPYTLINNLNLHKTKDYAPGQADIRAWVPLPALLHCTPLIYGTWVFIFLKICSSNLSQGHLIPLKAWRGKIHTLSIGDLAPI